MIANIEPVAIATPEVIEGAAFQHAHLARRAPRPTTVGQTGLSLTFLADLVIKHLATAGVLTTSQLMERTALAGPVLGEVLNFLRNEARTEVRSRMGLDAEMRYGLTERGHADAAEALARSGYVGPAPVPLSQYVELVKRQSVHARPISREAVTKAFAGVVISDELLDRLGPAVNSHRAMFLYGGAGTGKTYTARRLAAALDGLVLVPHAILVQDTVIELFDPLCHRRRDPCEAPPPSRLQENYDSRYVACNRPIVFTGGELAADMLEVQYDSATRTYAAPIQLKANNGFLLIDDLGRQRVDPAVLFNRWIVPMDSRVDSLTTGKGHHFEVPFDLVLVFSTNLQPQDLADDAFLRRLGYKIEFTPITAEQYLRIWSDVCTERGVDFELRIARHAIERLHPRDDVPLLPCHPRDLLAMALDRVAYLGEARIDEQAIEWAWDCYFLHGGTRGRGSTSHRGVPR